MRTNDNSNPQNVSANRVREIRMSRRELEHWAKTMRKSAWKQKRGHVWGFLCPHCKSERRVPFRRRPGGIHYFQVALTAAVFTLAAFPVFGWKGVISFVPMWAIFETLYRLRMRAALRCSHCGFDPYLYLVDMKKARTGVEHFWRKKFEEMGKPFPEKGKPYPPVVAAVEPSSGETAEEADAGKSALDRD